MSSMVDYAEYADELVEQIDAGELDPAEVDIEPFIEDDTKTLTPALADRLEGTGRIEEYNQRWTAAAERELEQRQSEQAREQRNTLETIRETVRDEKPGTETLEFRGEEIEVNLDIPGRFYDVVDTANAIESGKVDPEDINFSELADQLIDACLAVIVDGPEDLMDRSEWERFYDNHGFDALNDVLEVLIEPAQERQEELGKFRGEHRRGGITEDV